MLKAHASTIRNAFTRKALTPLIILIDVFVTQQIPFTKFTGYHHTKTCCRVSMFTCLLKNDFNKSYILCHADPLPGTDHKKSDNTTATAK
jgi:hypothetical protein